MRASLLMLLTATVLSALGATGCHHRRAEGPAERAGEAIDDAARKTKDAAKDAAHDAKRDLDRR